MLKDGRRQAKEKESWSSVRRGRVSEREGEQSTERENKENFKRRLLKLSYGFCLWFLFVCLVPRPPHSQPESTIGMCMYVF